MNILVHFGHPAHVHLFKNLIYELESEGHNFIFTHRDKEITKYLLNKYKFNSNQIVQNRSNSYSSKLSGLIESQINIYKLILKNKPDIMLGVAAGFLAHVGKLLGIPVFILDDTEHSKIEILLYRYFSTKIFTPNLFGKHLGHNHELYNSYHEIAYLHRSRFKPNPKIKKFLGVKKGEKYVIVRFVSWGALHDDGFGGFTPKQKVRLVNELSKFAKIFISSEGFLPDELKDYKINIPFEKMHDALYYSCLHIGEGTTMANESALLGVPTIYVSSLPEMGVVRDIEKYGLLKWYKSYNSEILSSAKETIINYRNISQEVMRKNITIK